MVRTLNIKIHKSVFYLLIAIGFLGMFALGTNLYTDQNLMGNDIINATWINGTSATLTNLYATNLETNLDGTGFKVTAANFSGNLTWTDLYNYPVACPADSAITTLDDSVTCTAYNTGLTWLNSTNVNTTNLYVDTIDGFTVGDGTNNVDLIYFDGERDWVFSVNGSGSSSNLMLSGKTADKKVIFNDTTLYIYDGGLMIKNIYEQGHRGSIVYNNGTSNMITLDVHDSQDASDGNNNTHFTFYASNSTLDSIGRWDVDWGYDITNMSFRPGVINLWLRENNITDIGYITGSDVNVLTNLTLSSTNHYGSDIVIQTGNIKGALKIGGTRFVIEYDGANGVISTSSGKSIVFKPAGTEALQLTSEGGILYKTNSVRPTATEGVCYWNTTAGYKGTMCYNSTHWKCADCNACTQSGGCP